MTNTPGKAAHFSSRLMRTGVGSLFVIGLFLILLPFFALPPTDLHWLIVVITALTSASLSLYLCFEALLFRLLASFPDEAEGGAAVDDFLARARLRKPAAALRSLDHRMRGSKRIIWLQRLALLAFLVALVSMP